MCKISILGSRFMHFLQTQKKPFISLPHIILVSKLSFALVLVMIIGISASIISVQAQQDYDIPQWVKNTMLIPMSFGELYYNNEYSFSVQYPDNWRVDRDAAADGEVSFLDGVEEGAVYNLWESNTFIYPVLDMGEKLSDYEEKQWARESSEQYCNEANYANDDYRCGSFVVISQVSGKSLDGYPTITTKSTEVRKYQDLSNNTPMIVLEKLIYVDDDIWVINSNTDADKFSEYENRIYATMNSFRYPASPPIENSGGGCLIATAAYGSEMAPQVQLLREIRDNQLLQTQSGTQFMGAFNDIYYSFSPVIADYERENPYFKEAVKLAITPMISTLSLMENAESESEVLGLGLSVIALNLGMYLGVPAIVIIGIRKKI